MPTKKSAIFLVIITTLFTSIAQLSYKYGLNNISALNLTALTNPYSLYVLVGLVLYCVGAVLLIISLKAGEVSVLYPIIATSYIWVCLLSVFFLNEPMNFFKWLGVFIVMVGIIIIALSSKGDELIKSTSAVI